MNTQKLFKQEDIVTAVLEECPETRGDDFLLYSEILRRTRPDLQLVSVGKFFENHEIFKAPSYEAFSRVRRKVQKKRPDLLSEKIQKRRAEQAKEYRAYALSEGV